MDFIKLPDGTYVNTHNILTVRPNGKNGSVISMIGGLDININGDGIFKATPDAILSDMFRQKI